MKPQSMKQKGCTPRHNKKLAACAGLILLLPLAARAGGTVTNCTEADFLAAAGGGGTVTFACDGTITLSQTFTNNVDTVLDGTGHQIRISGSNAVRLFWVATNLSFTVVNLSLVDGFADNGAAVLNYGNLQLTGVGLSNNAAPRTASQGLGGAIWNAGGRLTATNCFFANNRAYCYPFYPEAGGGAIRNENGGQVTLEQCVFASNLAIGSNYTTVQYGPPPAPAAAGGAIDNRGALVVHCCTFAANSAIGGQGVGNSGNLGGSARGGAVFNGGDCTVYRSTCSSNVALGGAGGSAFPATGGAGYSGGAGASGLGGALCNSGTASLINCTIAGNRGSGGNGGVGGAGASAFYYGFNGGNGGNGGDGCGGVNGASTIIKCTLAFNTGTAGVGGSGGPGGYGHITSGVSGTNGLSGTAWGATTYLALPNTLIASNNPVGSNTFSAPKLGPLADNGGPTLTMALLPGSPAIDAGNTAIAPLVDQRGFPRPAGAAADIGAFEYGSVMPSLVIAPSVGTSLQIIASGNAGAVCRLLVSQDLSHWSVLATSQIGAGGTVLFYDDSQARSCRFYGLVMP